MDYGHSHRGDKFCTHVAYSLSCAQYDAMRDRAQDACEICRTPDADTVRGELIIDHYQWMDLFFVRGLLCDRCNQVMARHDRKVTWGPKTQPWREKAAAYHRSAWGATPDQLALADRQIAARTPWTRRLSGLTAQERA